MIPDEREVAERIERIFRRMIALLTVPIVRGQAAGIFNPELDERAIGNFLLCAIQGLRVLGKMNHNEQELVGIVDMVMRALD
jgi:TetR/AcrR family transcriptional repressor of nem operon